MRIKETVIGELLFYANSAPGLLVWKQQFYLLKNKLITLYGEYCETHLQHIVKECWDCGGSGKLYQEFFHLGEPTEIYVGPCRRCNKGVYSEFWTVLGLYKIGRRYFHMPLKRYDAWQKGDIPDIQYTKHISGYIEHVTPRFYLHMESMFWLFLFFEPKLFWAKIGRVGCPSWKFTPMVILSNAIFNLRSFGNRVPRLFRLLKSWQQKNCDHMFPEWDPGVVVRSNLDICPWCGMERGDFECPF